ncbi:MAG TPA: hypothetical protein VMJ74_06875 [Pseudomonadales bacterium]|nr:hypothetical protein [Pseudomonadales bacterium]
MKFRRSIAGEWSGALIKFIALVVFVLVFLPRLLQCAARLPQTAAEVATDGLHAIGNGMKNAASDAADATARSIKDAACNLPAVGSAVCAPSPPSQTKTDPAKCLTVDEAALEGLANAKACTQAVGREFSGNVSWHNVDGKVCFGVDGPYIGDERMASTPPETRPGWKAYAQYHSHPLADSSPRFSAGDLCNYVANAEIGYVVATQYFKWGNWHLPFVSDEGEVRKFVPYAGSIYARNDSQFHTCVYKTSDSGFWVNSVFCPLYELALDADPGAGTITKLPTLATGSGSCSAAAATGRNIPPAQTSTAALLKSDFFDRCTALPQ